MQNRYNLLYVDFSWLLTRNVYILTKDKEINEFNPGEIIRLAIQTLRKIGRDYGITANKIIAITDLWDTSIGGYYRTEMLKDFVKFKGSRHFMTPEKLETLKEDQSITPEQLKEAERELAINNLKQYSKHVMLEEFPKIGIYTYGKPGYEFDDIATLASFMRGNNTNIQQKDVIVTLDSDLSYSLSPGCDLFKPEFHGKPGKITTYEEMLTTIPEELKEKGVSLYMYHAYMDSLGYTGHNDLAKTRKVRTDPVETILKILNNDYSNVKKVELFKAQLNTFNLPIFPEYQTIQNDIANLFESKGIIGTVNDFHEFCRKYDITGISDDYYLTLTGMLDQRLYSGL